MIRRVLISAGVLAAALLGVVAPSALANSLFGVIKQASLSDDDVAPLAQANPSSMRFLLDWTTVQPTKGPCSADSNYSPGIAPASNNCDWATVDQVIRVSADAGVKGFPFLFGSPDWLNGHGKATSAHPYVPPIYGSQDQAAWKDFVSAAVDRYGRGGTFWQTYSGTPHPITDWQIWNEPTSPTYWAPRPNVGEYAQLVKISHAAIHDADPNARVVLAGVFGTPLQAGGGINLPEYFERLYRIPGVERYFDVAAVHPYSPGVRGVRLQIETARKLMREAGDGQTKLWISEIGWASSGPKNHTLTSTLRGQARLLQKTFTMLRDMRVQWHLAGVNWFSWRDVPRNQSSCAACPHTGLLREDGSPKPAFHAFESFTG